MSTPRVFRKVRRPFEHALVYLGMGLIPLLPRGLVLSLANLFGAVAYACSARLRRLGQVNLELAFGDTLTESQRNAILRRSLKSFSLTLLDIFWFSRNSESRFERWLHFDETLDQVMAARPLVCVTGHFGNWEQLGQALSLRGLRLASVAAPLKNQAVDRMFLRLRKKTGQEIVPRQGAMKRLLQVLREGGSVAVLLDQNTNPSEGGVFVDFFGLPAPVAAAPAALAVRTGAHVVIGHCLHRGGGHYAISASAVLDARTFEQPDLREAALACTREITRCMEAAIRAHPECWLWSYKRWKLIAPGTDPARYPYYAHPEIMDAPEAGGLPPDAGTR